MAQHPVQPLVRDKEGVIRFKENKIVRFLLGAGSYDLNRLARMGFNQEDHEQFDGFGDLSYVSDETYARADAQRQNVDIVKQCSLAEGFKTILDQYLDRQRMSGVQVTEQEVYEALEKSALAWFEAVKDQRQ